MSSLLVHAMAPAASGKPLAAAQLAELLARLFDQAPTAEALAEIASVDTTPFEPAIATSLQRLAAAAAVSDPESCRREHTRLFHDPQGAVVLLWESTWTENPPRLMGRSHSAVLRDYEQAGFRPRLDHDPADHVALELGFIALLAARGDHATLQKFWQGHVVTWMPRLARSLSAAARLPLYAALAELLDTSLATSPDRSTNERRKASQGTANV